MIATVLARHTTLVIFLAAGYFGILTIAWFMLLGIRSWGQPWLVEEPHKVPPQKSDNFINIRVSVCTARNEEENIGDCIQAVLGSTWPNLEVILVDDRSEDRTREVAESAASGDTRLRIVDGVEPHRSWAGKPWACYESSKGGTRHFFIVC